MDSLNQFKIDSESLPIPHGFRRAFLKDKSLSDLLKHVIMTSTFYVISQGRT